MAYGLWLYKEIETKQGSRRIEIHKRNYTGASIEIDALADDGVVLSMDGGDITDPIIGTTLSLSIIDTEQIDTSLFFTPDATLYRVQLFFGATLEWSGYLTPDSYSENLAYRDIVSLVARDNLGRLNDYTLDTERGMMSIQELVETLLGEVSCPMYLNWRSTKVANVADANTATSVKATDAFVDTHYFVGKTYREIVEEVLKGIGCQMRFSGQNNLSILDLAQIPTLDTKDAFFIEKSGYKEIRPAWKDVTIEQDYGKVDNFFDGYLNEEQSGSSTFFIPSEQMPGKWEGDSLYFANQYGWNTGIEDNQSESIYPAINTKLPQNSCAIYKKEVRSTNQMVSLTMSLNNTARRLKNVVFNSTSNLYTGEDGRVKYTLTYMFSVYMRDKSGKMYIMLKDRWSEDTGNDLNPLPIMFKMPECIYEDQGTWNKEQEVSIQINSLPSDGELLILFHNVGWSESDSITDYQYFGKIRDIRLAYTNDIGGQSSRIQLDSVHNIQSSIQFSIGQVPYGKGDNNAYWGGLFTSARLPLSSWSMSEDSALKYNLLELVGREHIHYNKKNYELLSGTMMSDSSLSLEDNITYKGKIYAIISASLNVLSGRVDITSMQEVEEYQVAELTIIDSPVESSSGTRLGSGSNEVIQFSNDAGNAKRLYELDQASQEDMEDSYLIIDKSSMSAAKRVPLKAVGGLFNKAFRLHYNEDGVLVSVEVLANLWTNFGITAGGEGTGTGGGTGGATSLEGLNDVSLSALIDGQSLVWSSTLNKWINKTIEPGLDEDALSDYLVDNDYAVKGDIPSSLKSPYKLLFGEKSYDGSAEITITAADLGALTEHQDISYLLSKEEAEETYQVKGNYLTGITSKMVTDALTYTPLANTTKYALSDSVGGDALNSAKFGGQLPAYYATATSVTKVAEDLSTFKTLFDSMFEKKDGKIHAKLTLWTDYALVAGGEGDGTGGGGGGGLTSFSVIVNNKTYNSDNGVATITEQLQPLITANNKLAYSLISGTPTSLPASDVYDWAKAETKPSYAASEVGALSTSGGTMANNAGIKWSHNVHSWNEPADGFECISTTNNTLGYYAGLSYKGYYGLQIRAYGGNTDDIKVRGYNSSTWGTWRTIIHSGNYSSYALPLSGGTVTGLVTFANNEISLNGMYLAYSSGALRVRTQSGDSWFGMMNDSACHIYTDAPQFYMNKPLKVDNGYDIIHSGNIGSYAIKVNPLNINIETDTNVAGYGQTSGGWPIAGPALLLSNSGGSYAMMLSGRNGILRFNTREAGTLTGWKQIAFTDSNVASATKLQNARTIWGQSFDGSANVFGQLSMVQSKIFWHSDNSNYYIGCPTVTGGAYLEYKAYSGHRFLGGNVIIGTTTDNGYKLDINGGSLRLCAAISSVDSTVAGFYTYPTNPYGLQMRANTTTGDTYLQARREGKAEYFNLVLEPDGGNVLIGTTTDNGGKLQISNTPTTTNNDVDMIALRYNASWSGYPDGLASITTIDSAGGVVGRFGVTYANSVGNFVVKGLYNGGYDASGVVFRVDGNGDATISHNLSVGNNISTSGNLTVNGSATFASGYRHLTRTGNTPYNSGWLYGTNGQEAMAFINNAAVSSFMFVQGKTAIENWGAGTWQSVTPALQIKQNCVAINYLWGQNVTPDYTLRVEGSAYFSDNISASGAITAGVASDIRLKDSIQAIDPNKAIGVLMALNPITYQWNDIARELGGYEGISQGFIAQEYESIIPNSGRVIWGEYRAIDYTKAIPYIVSVEQNHEQRIRQLEEELKRLRREYYGIQ